jgi:hypothetical protein
MTVLSHRSAMRIKWAKEGIKQGVKESPQC